MKINNCEQAVEIGSYKDLETLLKIDKPSINDARLLKVKCNTNYMKTSSDDFLTCYRLLENYIFNLEKLEREKDDIDSRNAETNFEINKILLTVNSKNLQDFIELINATTNTDVLYAVESIVYSKSLVEFSAAIATRLNKLERACETSLF